MAPAWKNLVLDELADPSRRAILDHLRTGEKTVSALVEHTGLKQPNVSNHLGKMRQRGIVSAQKVGRQQIYRLADPLVEQVLHTALSGATGPAPAATTERVAAWSDAYFHAVTTADEQRATQVVSECLMSRLPMPDLYVDLFQSALSMVGEWYSEGRLSEAEEHFATAVTERLMARASHFYPSDLPNGRRAVLGCVAGNWHAVGLRMIADILSHHGWTTAYLGANVPTQSFVELVCDHNPDMVFISCAQEFSADETRNLIARLRERRESSGVRHFLIGVGGGWINRHPDFISETRADFTAPDLRSLTARLEALLGVSGIK